MRDFQNALSRTVDLIETIRKRSDENYTNTQAASLRMRERQDALFLELRNEIRALSVNVNRLSITVAGMQGYASGAAQQKIDRLKEEKPMLAWLAVNSQLLQKVGVAIGLLALGLFSVFRPDAIPPDLVKDLKQAATAINTATNQITAVK